MKTRQDVIEFAFRRLGIKSEDEGLSADQQAYASDVLDGLHAEMSIRAPMTWWPDQIDDAVAVALGNLLAAEIGPSYATDGGNRATAYARVMAAILPDNRRDEDRPDGTAAYF